MLQQVSSHTLMEAFGRFGKIASAVVMYDQEGVSRGFGFVNYVEERAAQLAIDHFSKTPRPGNAWQARPPSPCVSACCGHAVHLPHSGVLSTACGLLRLLSAGWAVAAALCAA